MSTSSTQGLVEILREGRELLARPGNEFVWSHWDSAEAALHEIDGFIVKIESGDTAWRSDLEAGRRRHLDDNLERQHGNELRHRSVWI